MFIWRVKLVPSASVQLVSGGRIEFFDQGCVMGAGSPIKLSMPEGGPVDMMFGGDDPLKRGSVNASFTDALNANVLLISDVGPVLRHEVMPILTASVSGGNAQSTLHKILRTWKAFSDGAVRCGYYGAPVRTPAGDE